MKKIERLLLVDDDPSIQKLVKIIFEKDGSSKLDIVSNGKEALEFLENEKVDIILMDVHMPIMSGPETLSKLRKNEELKSTPVLFMTAQDEDKMVTDYNDLGALGFIQKPIKPNTLIKQITDIFLKQQGREQC